jgi:hypothetical protein
MDQGIEHQQEAASCNLLLMLDPLIHRGQRIKRSLCPGQNFTVPDARPATFRNGDNVQLPLDETRRLI